MAGSPQHHDSATFDAAIEIEDSRWIENLLRHMTPVLATSRQIGAATQPPAAQLRPPTFLTSKTGA
jgi:hypothetical protein